MSCKKSFMLGLVLAFGIAAIAIAVVVVAIVSINITGIVAPNAQQSMPVVESDPFVRQYGIVTVHVDQTKVTVNGTNDWYLHDAVTNELIYCASQSACEAVLYAPSLNNVVVVRIYYIAVSNVRTGEVSINRYLIGLAQ